MTTCNAILIKTTTTTTTTIIFLKSKTANENCAQHILLKSNFVTTVNDGISLPFTE